jgi:hypothetical protein
VSDEAPAVRLRGIYTTALTERLSGAGATVVQASGAIRRRFDGSFPDEPADVAVETTGDRRGVGATGDPEAVEWVAERLADVARDALPFPEPAPSRTVVAATVGETLGGGAAVDLGDREGYLPFDAVDGYVEAGDPVRVQVRDPAPPWADRRPTLDATVRVGGELVTLVRGESGISAAADRERTTELARTTELLPAEAPDGWGIRWEHAATEAGMDAMGAALSAAAGSARALDAALADDGGAEGDGGERPRTLATPAATRWVWFGRESRFALDGDRRAVTQTMGGHHRIKAATGAASDAVDFVEAVCDPGETFPFDAVTDQFGPDEGDRVGIGHGKPAGRVIDLGPAEVTAVEADGTVRLRREIAGSGTYDGLDTPQEPGDVAITRVKEGRWWYPTVYKGEDGSKGTYVNVCTPVEAFPDCVRYVDLHVDVVKRPGGEVERLDDDELDAAVEAGRVSEPLAEKAREVARSIENAL